MRSPLDRIRHAISFEVLGLAIITPVGSFLLEQPAMDIGLLGLMSATAATVWNYLYNLGFDKLMYDRTGSPRKSVAVRVAHAILFELGLLVALLPLISWYLNLGIIEALATDASFALFYMVYAFVFNWSYDLIFPDGKTAEPA